MMIILFVLLLSFLISFLLTPFVGRIGARLGALDRPDERKLHRLPIPRVGGCAIFLSFMAGLLVTFILNPGLFQNALSGQKAAFFLLGSLVCFGIGLADDFKRVNPKIKFLFQILGATIAYLGGIQIEKFLSFDLTLSEPILSYFLTVFWFLLLINAVNLIDGLDGLAGGIAFFASLVIGLFSAWRGQIAIAIMFFALSGATLGFLRYNFTPATIFMGDGGSYLIGYLIAGLSILGISKGETSAVLLIFLVAMGIPVFDTILAPIRRFVLGQKIFHPDRSHIHHRLIALGLSTRKVVLILYGVSIALGVISIVLVNLRNGAVGIFLIVLGIGAMLLTKKLGYFEFLAVDKVYGWLKDITDEAGLNRGRRNFLRLQIGITDSKTSEELWQNVCKALETLKFSQAEFYPEERVKNKGNGNGNGNGGTPGKGEKVDPLDCDPASSSGKIKEGKGMPWVWSQTLVHPEVTHSPHRLLKIELPMVNGGNSNFGTLRLIKDLNGGTLDNYTLRRVESLRRTVVETIDKMTKGGNGKENVMNAGQEIEKSLSSLTAAQEMEGGLVNKV